MSDEEKYNRIVPLAENRQHIMLLADSYAET